VFRHRWQMQPSEITAIYRVRIRSLGVKEDLSNETEGDTASSRAPGPRQFYSEKGQLNFVNVSSQRASVVSYS
jgi:hypothetical protein